MTQDERNQAEATNLSENGRDRFPIYDLDGCYFQPGPTAKDLAEYEQWLADVGPHGEATQ